MWSSGLVGSATAREIIGPGIIYEPATLYSFTDVRELGLYAVLGVAAALFGLAFLYGEDLAKRVSHRADPGMTAFYDLLAAADARIRARLNVDA